MRILYSSPHGIIIELDGLGVRLVTKDGFIGPILRSPQPIAEHMPFADWVEDHKTDLGTWLEEHGVERRRLRDPSPYFG